MTEICRLCLSRESVNHRIFDKSALLYKKIEKCLPIKVSRTDLLPKTICQECCAKIDDIYEYYETTLQAEKKLLLCKDNFTSTKKNHFNYEFVKNEVLLKINKKESLLDCKNFTSAFTQTDFVCFKEESVVETKEKQFLTVEITNDVKIKVETEINLCDQDNVADDVDNQYTSDDDIALNKIVKKEAPPGAKNEKKKVKRSLCDDETPAKRAKRRPRGAGNKKYKAMEEVEKNSQNTEKSSQNEVEDENDIKMKLDFADRWFYPKGTPEDVKKWKCLTCFAFLKTRSELLKHYSDHVKNPTKFISNSENSDVKNELVSTQLEDGNSVNKKAEMEDDNGVHYTVITCPEFGNGSAFQCLKCLKMFLNKRSVVRHLVCHDNSRPFPCNICGRAYKRAYEIFLHGRAHNGVKTLFCTYDQCDYSTVYRGALSSHMKRHDSNYKYTCEVCHKGFDVLTWFNEHKNIHTGAKPFPCEICGKTFAFSRYLTSHRNSVHRMEGVASGSRGQQLVHRCSLCKLHFPQRTQLRTHEANVHGNKIPKATFLCDICGKALSSAPHLKCHRKTHTGEKPHACGTCGKAFVKKCNLTLHERVHSGEKPHVCSHCGKAFSQRSTLVIHERYHSGARPYECQTCNKGFVAKGLLSMHLKTCFRNSVDSKPTSNLTSSTVDLKKEL